VDLDVRARPQGEPILAEILVSDVRRTFRPAGGAAGTGADHARPTVALDGMSFAVPDRQVVALVGPTGCGKSTLLRIVGGLLPADAGRVAIDERPVVGVDPAVGFVFQEPRLMPWRSALDNVAFPLEVAGLPAPERQARARDLLDLVGLADFAAARPHQLSGGMRQRVAICRALASEPSVLLLDEPFSALDALTRERFGVGLLRIWERRPTTILLVTHSIPEAVFLADRVLVLSSRPGHVVADVPIDLPRPRRPEDLDSPAAGELAVLVRRQLDAVMGEAGAGGWEAEEPAQSVSPSSTSASGSGVSVGAAVGAEHR
jgi:NitT/TauT family transport system ATP-binding protein